jgi:hypothetical protein
MSIPLRTLDSAGRNKQGLSSAGPSRHTKVSQFFHICSPSAPPGYSDTQKLLNCPESHPIVPLTFQLRRLSASLIRAMPVAARSWTLSARSAVSWCTDAFVANSSATVFGRVRNSSLPSMDGFACGLQLIVSFKF